MTRVAPKGTVAVRDQPPLISSMLNSSESFLAGAAITLVLLYFLLSSGDRFLQKVAGILPTASERDRAVEMTHDVQNQLSRYLFTITMINIGLGCVIGCGLWAIGLPHPVLWGVVAMLLNYIPFAGFAFGTVLVFVVALISFDTLGHAVLAPLVYIVVNSIEANFVTPALVGKSVSLHPVVVVLSVFFGGWFWGIGGVLLAVPLLLIFKVCCEHSVRLAPVAEMLSQ